MEIIVSVLPTTNFFPPNFYRQFSPGREFEALRSRSSREKDYAANGREAKGREGGSIREFSRDSGSTREAKPLDPIRLSSPSRLIVCNGLCSAPPNSSTLEN